MKAVMKLTKEKRDVLAFLQEHSLGTLATVNASGTPEAMAVYFFTEKDFSICFVTKAKTRKIQNALTYPKATLLTYNERELASAELVGHVKIVYDMLEFAQVIEKFEEVIRARKSMHRMPPIAQIQAGEYVACKLVPERVYFRKFNNRSGNGTLPKEIVIEIR